MLLEVVDERVIPLQEQVSEIRTMRVVADLAVLSFSCDHEEFAGKQVATIHILGLATWPRFARLWVNSPDRSLAVVVPRVPVAILDESQ